MLDITKIFPGVVANDRVNFTVDKGEIHALGGGKNTRYEEKPDIYSRLY